MVKPTQGASRHAALRAAPSNFSYYLLCLSPITFLQYFLLLVVSSPVSLSLSMCTSFHWPLGDQHLDTVLFLDLCFLLWTSSPDSLFVSTKSSPVGFPLSHCPLVSGFIIAFVVSQSLLRSQHFLPFLFFFCLCWLSPGLRKLCTITALLSQDRPATKTAASSTHFLLLHTHNHRLEQATF